MAKITGTTKSSSYSVQISSCYFSGWEVNLGTYDIGDWNRHTNLGPFATEAEALTAFEAKIVEAEFCVEVDKKAC